MVVAKVGVPSLRREKMKMNDLSLCTVHSILHPQSRRV